jgi:hypothetical protein
LTPLRLQGTGGSAGGSLFGAITSGFFYLYFSHALVIF